MSAETGEASRARVEIAVAVVECEGRFLVGRRAEGAALAGYDEFPGGKLLPGETAAKAAVRECREESGLRVEAREQLATTEHDYAHAPLRLTFWRCVPLDPQAELRPPFRWVPRAEMAALCFPPANAAIIAQLVVQTSDPNRAPAC